MADYDFEPTDAERAAALIQILRQRNSGIAELSAGGRFGQASGMAQVNAANGAQNQLQERTQFGLTQALQRQRDAAAAKERGVDNERQAKRDEESARHNRIQEARPPANIFLPGAEGYVAVNPRSPNATAQPVVDAQGNAITKPKAPLQQSDRDDLQKFAADARSIRELRQRFKPEYAGMGPIGDVVGSATQALGSWAPEKAQEADAFWADFAQLQDLPQRNAIFGASLSPGEKASWEGAKNVKRGVDPKIAIAKMDEMVRIADSKLGARKQSLLADGYKPEAVDALVGGTNGPQAQSGRKAVKNKAGKVLGYINPDGSEELVP